MTGVHRLEHVERLATTDLADGRRPTERAKTVRKLEWDGVLLLGEHQ